MFLFKDGDASLKSGEDEELVVMGDNHNNGRNSRKTIAWLTFQTQMVDLSHATEANLSINLVALKKTGTLRDYALSEPISKLEDRVSWDDVRFDASQPVATLRIEPPLLDMIVNLDVTAAIKSGSFHGLALASEDHLQAAFSARESGMPHMIQLKFPALRSSRP